MRDQLLISAGDMLLALTSMLVFCYYNRINPFSVRWKIILFTAFSGVYAGAIYAPAVAHPGAFAMAIAIGFDIKFFVWSLLLGKRLSLSVVYIAYATMTSVTMISSIPKLAIKVFTGHAADTRTQWLISIFITMGMLFFLWRVIRTQRLDGIVATLKKITVPIYVLLALLMQVMESMLTIIAIDAENFNKQRQVYQFLTILFFILLIAVTMSLVINNLAQTQYKEISRLLEKQVREQVARYQEQLRADEELKRFRHDYRNHMECIGSLVHSGATADAQDYIARLAEKMSFDTNRFDTGNPLVNAILGEKERLASANHIAFSASGFFHPLFSVTDTCIILGNALDNALEACGKLDKYRFISVDINVHKPYQMIVIKNSAGEVTDLSTTKSDRENHGFGLSNIARAVKDHDGTMLTECENGVFTLSVTVKVE
ncbi:MAG: GHKL domain-containing protein [Oscillospiraceae bacterium]